MSRVRSPPGGRVVTLVRSSSFLSSSASLVLVAGWCIAAWTTQVEARTSINIPSFQRIDAPTFSLTISGTSGSLDGPMDYHPGMGGSALPLPNAGGDLYTGVIRLPNIIDLNDPEACGSNWNTTDEYGQSLQGAWVLVQQSTKCAAVAYSHAAASGAAGVLAYGCPSTPPFYCEPRLTEPILILPVPIPVLSITGADGQRIIAYLKSRQADGTYNSGPAMEFTALSTGNIDPLERAALVAIASKTAMSGFVSNDYPQTLPLWTVARFMDANIDPCRDRAKGIWCESGHIRAINVLYHQWYIYPGGGPPPEFAAFTKLRHLNVMANVWIGDIPPEWCTLSELVTLRIGSQYLPPKLTSLPSCLGNLTNLVDFQCMDNAIPSLPASMANWKKIKSFYVYNNVIADPLPSFAEWAEVEFIDASGNQLTQFPTMPPLTAPLKEFGLATNAIVGTLASTVFDYPTLQIVDLNTNHISGPLPAFNSPASILALDFGSQRYADGTGGFTGGMPATWGGMQAITKLQLQENQLSGAMYSSRMQNLQTIDLSHNQLFGAVPEDPTNKATNLWFNTVYSAAMRVLRVSYNRLGGIALPPGFLVEGRMEEIYCDHNEFLNVWPEIFTASIPLAIVDFSHNLLAAPTAATDFAAGAPAPQFRKLDFTGNPNFRLATLPSWITIDVTRVQQPGDLFSCSTFSANTAPNMIFKVDAIFFEYKHCGCVPGTFGSAPVCQYVPTGVVLNPYAQISSPELASVSSVITAEGGIASQLTLPNVTAYPVSAETAKATPAGAELYVPAFSDGMYGADSRLTLGMATSWVVDLQDLYADNIDEYTARELTVPVPIETYRLNISALDASIDKSLLTPVRVIVLRLHVSATAFDAFSDQIMIYEGDSSLKGNRVYSLRGTDGLPAVSASEYTSTSAYIHLHNASLSQIDSPALIEIPVYSPIATVAFNSRDISGNHFYATYSYAFECPDGYFYNLDLSPPQCRVNRTSFVIDSGIRSAVFAVGALAMAVVLANIIVMAVRWESPVFKAASRPFMLLMLVLLFCMALGSLLYAAIPDPSLKSSAAICIGRAWLTCLPLAGFLAILLAKTSRLDAIFGATTLQVRKHSDADLLKTVAAVAALQIVLLAVFSGMPLSKAAILVGKGSQSDQLVTQCTQESGFMSWLGAEIAFIVCLILPAAYFGFRTRDLPSQYNESGHIQNCLIFMAFFLCVVVPLDNFIKDNPEATVLIQGLGQAFLCILMTLIMFGPKCYYLSNLSSRARGVGNVGGPTQIPTAIDAEKSGSGTMASSGYASTKPASNNVARKTSTLGPTGGSTGQRTSTLGSGQSSTVRPLPVTMNPNLKRDSSVTPTNGTGSATQSPLADGRKSISGATGARTIPAATSVSPRLGAAVPTVLPTAVPAVALTDPGVASPSNIHVLVSSPPNSPRRQIKVHGLSASSHTIGSPSAQQ